MQAITAQPHKGMMVLLITRRVKNWMKMVNLIKRLSWQEFHCKQGSTHIEGSQVSQGCFGKREAGGARDETNIGHQ